MKKKLDFDYDVQVDGMDDIKDPIGEYKVSTAEFYSIIEDKTISKDVLAIGEPGILGTRQIFKMKDGKYILEVEEVGDVEYFYSETLEDLI